jgi:hypothetical protein
VDNIKTRQAVFLHRNIEVYWRKHFCRGKSVNVAYSEYVSVALIIQLAERVHHVTLPFVACLAVPYFFTLSYKRHDSLELLLNVKYMFLFSQQL